LFDDSKQYKTINGIPTCPQELRFDTITPKQLSNMIETFISELQQAVDLKDFSLSKRTQYDIEIIKMIQERYNHKWSVELINDLTLKETQKFINMKEHLLRMYYHLLLQTVAQIQGGMIPKMLPPDLIEQFDALKQELGGFNFSLNGTTVDQLLGVYLTPPSAVASSSLVDILAGEVAQGPRPSVQTTEDVIRYLQYYLIHDLHRLFVGDGRNRKRFITFFIEMINKNHQINDTTGQEVDDIKNANSYAKYQEYKTNDAKMTSDTSVGKAEDNKFIISQMRRAGLTGRIDLDTGSIVREHVVAGGEQEAETGGVVETKTGVEEFLDGQVGAEDRTD
jgi:hypothetical protein